MRKILEFSLRHSSFVISINILLTVIMVFAASKIQMNSEVSALMPDTNPASELLKKYDPEEKDKNAFYMALEFKDEISMEALQVYEKVIGEILDLVGGYSDNIFTATTFLKEGGRLAPKPLVPKQTAPRTEEDFRLFLSHLEDDIFSRKIFFSDSGKVLNTFFYHPLIVDTKRVTTEYYKITEQLEPYFTTYTTGNLFFMENTSKYLSKDLVILLTFSIIVILVFFFLGFRAKRAIFLPMAIVIMGTIWSLGIMGLLGYELTVISVVIPTLVLTIGTSYTIHILNQYYHDAELEHEDNKWIIDASLHVNKTVLMASLTTIVGFLSLLFTSIAASREFAISTSVGIAMSAVLSLTFLPAALSRFKSPEHHQKHRVQNGRFTRAMSSVSLVVSRFRIVFTIVFLIIIALFFNTYPRVTHQSDYVSYYPQDDPIVVGLKFMMENFEGGQRLNLTIQAPEDELNYFLDYENLEKISNLEETLKGYDNIMNISSFSSVIKDLNHMMNGSYTIPEKRGLILLLSKYFRVLNQATETGVSSNMVNNDFTRINLTIMIYNHENQRFLSESGLRSLVNSILAESEKELGDDLSFDLWGSDLEYLHLAETVSKDQMKSTVISIVMVLLIASFFFKSILYGILTLIPLLSGIMLNFTFMVLTGIPLDVTTMMVTSVAIGVGVDDAIHYLLQFRKQLLVGGTIDEILVRCGKISGRPIALTTISIVGGLMVLALASFKGILYFGVLVSFTLTCAMIGTLIILPAILSLLYSLKVIKN
ncbi:MAG: MMPL family transporter [Spirochaetales bacterium]|nr:MMPL family transporter [Spirochaetales bacterium]